MDKIELPLRDIHLPETIGWSLAIGWWILLILIPLMLFLGYWIFKQLTRKTALKSAKKLLQDLKINNTLSAHKKLEIISALLRRVVISLNPRSDCASLTGRDWLVYLDGSLEKNAFSGISGEVLILGRFQKQPQNFDIEKLILLTERWLKAQKS